MKSPPESGNDNAQAPALRAAAERLSRTGLSAFMIRNRRGLSLLLQTVLIVVAYVTAYFLRFDGQIPKANMLALRQTLPLIVVIKLLVFRWHGLHQGMFRYAGIQDMAAIIRASSFASLFFIAASVFAFRLTGIPRSVFALDWLLTIALVGGKRLSLRLLRESVAHRRAARAANPVNTLIVGAGDAGEMALRELLGNAQTPHRVIGFLDDDRAKAGMTIRGVPILGRIDALPRIVERHHIKEILIAIPSAGQNTVQGIVKRCTGLNVRLQILPGLADLITGRITVQAIRDVSIEDLLFRAPVQPDPSSIRSDLAGRTVLISGAGGSIGSELARQVAQQVPATLVLLDVAETPLFHIEQELRARHPQLDLHPVIENVGNAAAMDRIFQRFRPQSVYHTAAYKHVPLMEANPCQAVLNNIRGTRILAEAARAHAAGKFVMISTDKAVRPGNIMGASKRVCELLVTSLNGNGTRFAAVRFGNVLGSNGSVIPIFREQIRNGGPLTVTHPDMTRYFMTIPEAVMLILQCGAMALESDIFVLDMGQPIRIVELAENMIRLSGLRLGKDIEIAITGLRPGEKLQEELVTYGEALAATDIPKINVLRKQCPGLQRGALMTAIETLETLAKTGDEAAVRTAIMALMAEDQACAECVARPVEGP